LRRRSARRVDLASFNAEHDDRTFGVDDIDWIARVIWSTQ
jgi:phage repressor protein C with HTH and peptisase S24 domain